MTASIQEESGPERKMEDGPATSDPVLPVQDSYKCVDGAGVVGSGGSDVPKPSRRTAAQERAEQKKRLLAGRMAPRPCKLSTCQKSFVPKRPQDWRSDFCCREHQSQFWVEANRLSAAVIKAGDLPLSIKSEYRPGISHVAQALAVLERATGDGWVSLRKLLPEVNPNVISKLRQAGFEIEMREVGERPYTVSHDYRRNWRRFQPGGRVEYQYRLVR